MRALKLVIFVSVFSLSLSAMNSEHLPERNPLLVVNGSNEDWDKVSAVLSQKNRNLLEESHSKRQLAQACREIVNVDTCIAFFRYAHTPEAEGKDGGQPGNHQSNHLEIDYVEDILSRLRAAELRRSEEIADDYLHYEKRCIHRFKHALVSINTVGVGIISLLGLFMHLGLFCHK